MLSKFYVLMFNRCPRGLEKKDTIPMTCGDRDECWYLSCGSNGICHNIDYGGGFYCDCPMALDEFKSCTNCTCDNLLIDSQSVLQISSRAIFAIFSVCMLMTRKHHDFSLITLPPQPQPNIQSYVYTRATHSIGLSCSNDN